MARKNHEQYCKKCRTIHALLTPCPSTPSPTSDPREPEARMAQAFQKEAQPSCSKYESMPSRSRASSSGSSSQSEGGWNTTKVQMGTNPPSKSPSGTFKKEEKGKRSPGGSGGKCKSRVMDRFRDPNDDEDDHDKKMQETSF